MEHSIDHQNPGLDTLEDGFSECDSLQTNQLRKAQGSNMNRNSLSPYLSNETRLADVIAAIQAMGTYKFYKLDFSGWAKRISGDPENHDYWKTVITDHPEFFRLDDTKKFASLVWRRNYQRTYHVDRDEQLSQEACNALSAEERRTRISRVPLSSSDISVLINTAVSIHSRALEKQKASRWWITPVVGLVGIVIGALLRSYLPSS